MRSTLSDFNGTPAHASFDHSTLQVGQHCKKTRTTPSTLLRDSGQQMSSNTSSPQVAASHPQPVSMTGEQSEDPPYRSTLSPSISSGSSSSSESESSSQRQSSRQNSRRSRMDRPRLGDRQRSNTIIVPKGRDVVQTEKRDYPPDDARAMSPRRNSEDIERLERGVRESLKEYASPRSRCCNPY